MMLGLLFAVRCSMFNPHVNECIRRRSHAQLGGRVVNIRLDVLED